MCRVENYISAMPPRNGPTRIDEANGQVGNADGRDRENVRFEVTDKSSTFSVYKTLRDLDGIAHVKLWAA